MHPIYTVPTNCFTMDPTFAEGAPPEMGVPGHTKMLKTKKLFSIEFSDFFCFVLFFV